MPFHLLTTEFYKLVKTRVRPGGAVAQNVEPNTMMFDAALVTIGKVFDHVDLYDAGGNVVMIAYDGPRREQARLASTAARLDDAFGFKYPLSEMVSRRRSVERLPDTDGAHGRFRAGGIAARDQEAQSQAGRVPQGEVVMGRMIGSVWLFLLIFLSGFALMGFEMLGSRYLNPYFGSGITTWACLIAVVLFAMMVGYTAGGIVADRSREIWIVSTVLSVVGVYLILVAFLANRAMEAIMLSAGYDFWGTMVAAVALTFLPVALLAALSPFFVTPVAKGTRVRRDASPGRCTACPPWATCSEPW